jgi:hypothetical protein
MVDVKNDEETVVLTKTELKDIQSFMAKSVEKDQKIADLSGLVAELKNTLESVTQLDPSISNLEVEAVKTGKYARLRKYDGKWVLGWTEKGVYRERNSLNEVVEYIDIIVKGVAKPVKMSLLSYINDCPQEVVEVQEYKKLQDKVKDEGLIPVMTFNDKTGEHSSTGRKVRSQVISTGSDVVFKLDGEEVVINQKYVNS